MFLNFGDFMQQLAPGALDVIPSSELSIVGVTIENPLDDRIAKSSRLEIGQLDRLSDAPVIQQALDRRDVFARGDLFKRQAL
jgi:hypothetical protein